MEGQNKGITPINGLIDSWVPRNFRFLRLILCCQGVWRCSNVLETSIVLCEAAGACSGWATEAKRSPPTDNAEL